MHAIRRIAVLALVVAAGACDSTTAPPGDLGSVHWTPDAASLSGGLLGSGYNTPVSPADSAARSGGMAGSGY